MGTFTLHGDFRELDGDAGQATEVYIRTNTQVLGATAVYEPARLPVVDGEFTVALPANDVEPEAFGYIVAISKPLAAQRSWSVPAQAPDTAVELRDFTDTTPLPVPPSLESRVEALEEAEGGVTDHGALLGLGDDDHPQYHNDARGDARYQRLGAALNARGYASGRFYLPDGLGTCNNDYVVMVANRLYACGVYTPRADVTVASWSVMVTSAGAGSTIKAGLWDVGDNGLPTTLFADLGSASGASVAALTVAASVAIPKGRSVVLGLVAQGGTPQVPHISLPKTPHWGIESASAAQLYLYGYTISTGLNSDGVNGALGAWPGAVVTGHSLAQPRAGLTFA